MDRNTIIGFVLIAVILITWTSLMPKKEQPPKPTTEIAQNIPDASDSKKAENTEIIPTKATEESPSNVTLKSDSTYFESAKEGTQKYYTVENEKLRIKFSNKGGKIYSVELKEYKTYHDKKPLILFEGDTNKYNLSFYTKNFDYITTNNEKADTLLLKRSNINTQDFFFELSNVNIKDTFIVEQDTTLVLAFRLYGINHIEGSNAKNNISYIEYKYTIPYNSYMIDFQMNFVGLHNVIDDNEALNFNFSNLGLPQERSIENERNASTIYYKDDLTNEVDYLNEQRNEKEAFASKSGQKETKKLKWVALKQQFFTSVIIAKKSFHDPILETIKNENDSTYVKSMTALLALEYEVKERHNIDMSLYFGPNHYNTLKSFKLDLERQIPLGWGFGGILSWINRFAVIPVFNFLDSFNMNYGLIILILTILIKIVLFPIAYKTYSSSAKMRLLKPDIEEITAKFPKKEDALKKQQATMALYKKAGVNPMAGCLPMLLQLPVLIALFRFFPASFELRQQGFLWADDLSTYDSILNLPFNIPFYGSHVSLFTLLMTITTIIYTKVNSDMMGSTNQMKGMKTMMYIMPVMFLGIFNNFSSALSYYYFLTNIITFIQMFIFRFIVDEEALKRKIEANKLRKTSNKKSAFQKKLEEMANRNKAIKPKQKK